MKVAILFLGMRAPRILKHNIEIFDRLGYDIFLHLDAKVNLEEYLKAAEAIPSSVVILEKRLDVFWGGFSMIEAQLNLISAAFAKASYDRFVLLSDDSMLIRDNKLVDAAIKENVDRISARLIGPEDEVYKRYNQYYFLDSNITALMRGRDIKDVAVGNKFFAEMQKMAQFRLTKRKVKMPIYYGSQWWILTHNTISNVLEILEENKNIEDSFRYSAIPDEMMFQTLVMRQLSNSSDPSKMRSTNVVGGPVFAEWSKPVKPYIYKSVKELPYEYENRFLFIRKIDDECPELIRHIYQKYYHDN